jgi:CRISPR system Cascade subunit CasE
MYLSRLILNPRSREARHDLADCQRLHARLMLAFPPLPDAAGPPRSALGVLYRVEPQPRTGLTAVLVQSRQRPDWSRLPLGYLLDLGSSGPENPACKPVGAAHDAIRAGDELVFRLLANPTRRVHERRGEAGDRLAGKRVELHGEEAWQDWLARKGQQAGFRVLEVRVRGSAAPGSNGDGAGEPIPDVRALPREKVTGVREDHGAEGRRARLTFGAVLFEGRLRVDDAALFRRALDQGIGSGKAYGFGLLSIARAGR